MVTFWEYLKALVSNWRAIVLLLFGIVGMIERFSDRKIPLPRWAKTTIAIGALVLAPFFAYREARLESTPRSKTVPSVNMFDDAAKRGDAGRTDFRFTLRNFGNAAAALQLSYVLLLDGREQNLHIQLPKRSTLEPQQQVDLNLPLVVTPETNADIWSGRSHVDVRIMAEYSGGDPAISKKYTFEAQFDSSTARFSTVRSE